MLESEDDYRPVPGEWIEDRLLRLLEELRAGDPRFNELKPWKPLDPGAVYAAVQRRDFDRAVGLICAKYGLDPDRVRLAWVDEIRRDRIAAHVQSEPFGEVNITIRRMYGQDPAGFGTVLAHEVGHAYLTDLGIENGGTWEGEATTDLVTMVKGLGKLTVNGVEQVVDGQRAGSRARRPPGPGDRAAVKAVRAGLNARGRASPPPAAAAASPPRRPPAASGCGAPGPTRSGRWT